MSRHYVPISVLAGVFLVVIGVCGSGRGQDETVADKPAAAPPPGVSLALLADPEVAQQLELTDQQKSQVADLLAKRAVALALAPDGARPGVLATSERQLAALLTEAQRTRWKDWQAEQAKRRLRFNFRWQRWIDVLQWLAGQANLSLVLDHPPPGTFNFTDNRAYTPTEAINLVNGYLLTKGYTLIRRGRMLLVIDLKEEIPPGVIPRVTAEQLAERGTFDLVRILFTIEDRNAEEVVKEIQPLLGPYGKAEALPKTKQILITDMAGRIRAIQKVIESMPKPKPPKPKPKPKPPEKPVLVSYPVKSADPAAVVEVLKALMPENTGARFVRDPKLDQINAYATPTQQAAVKRVIEQMEANNPESKKPRLKLHPIDAQQASNLLQMVQRLVPDAQLSLDPSGTNLVALAAPDDQKKISDAIDQFEQGGGGTGARKLEVYPVTNQKPEGMIAALQKLVPRSLLAVDADTRSIIAVATPADQAKIKRAIESLGQGATGENAPRLQVHVLTKPIPETMLTVLKSLVPLAQIQVDVETGNLIAVATPADQDRIRQALRQVEQDTLPVNTPQIELHPLGRLDPTTTLATLKNFVPRAKLHIDAKTGKLVAVATPIDQETIHRTLIRLGQDVSDKDTPRLQVHSLGKLNPTSPLATATLATLKKLVPRAQLQIDAKTGNLIAVATPDDQAAIGKLLEQFSQGIAAQKPPRLERHRLGKLDPTSTIATLKLFVPKAQLQVDAKTGDLIAVATPTDQETIRKTLEQLGQDVSDQDTPRLQVHSLGKLNPGSPLATTTLATLKKLVPRAQLQIDAKTGNLIAVATPADQETIGKLLEQFSQGVAGQQPPQLELHRLGKLDPTSTIATLKNFVPKAQLQMNAKTGNLIAVATPADQKVIRATLEQLRKGVSVADTPQLETHRLGKLQPAPTIATLLKFVPKAQLQADTKTGNLLAVATPADQETIRATLEQLRKGVSAAVTPQLKVYRLGRLDPTSTLTTLKKLVPKGQLQIDAKTGNLVAVAIPEDQETIGKTLEQLRQETSPLDTPQLEVHLLTALDPTSTLATLKNFVPHAQLHVDPKTHNLVVVATPTDQQMIRAILEELRADRTDPNAPVLRFYPLDQEAPKDLLALLGKLVPNAKVTVSADRKQLMVMATAKDHGKVSTTIDEFQKHGMVPPEQTLQIYPVTPTQRQRLQAVLKTPTADLKGVRVIGDAEPGELDIWATPDQHKRIAALLEKFKPEVPPGQQYQAMGYTVRSVDPAKMMTILQQLYPPPTRFELDDKNRRILIWARAADQSEIRAALEAMDSGEPVEKHLPVSVYPLSTIDPEVVIKLLKEMVPDATCTADQRAKSIVVTARSEDQEVIKKIIDKIESDSTAASHRVLSVYPVGRSDPQSVLAMLDSTLRSQATILPSPERRSLLVWAEPKTQKVIHNALQQLNVLAPKVDWTTKVYRFRTADPRVVQSVLKTLFPTAKTEVDPTNYRLVVSAAPEDQAQIQSTIEQIDPAKGTAGVPVARSYPITSTNPSMLLTTLQKIFTRKPEVQLSLDTANGKLLAVAAPADQKAIEALVKELDVDQAGPNIPVLKFYPLKTEAPPNLLTLLTTVAPRAKVTVSPDHKQLMVMAIAKDQEKIAKTIAEFEQHGMTPTRQLQVYPVTPAQRKRFEAVRQGAGEQLQDIRVITDAEPGELSIWATPTQHERIAEILKQLKREVPPGEKYDIQVYPCRAVDPAKAAAMLQQLYPSPARFEPDQRGRRLLIWARAADQPAILNALKAMDTGDAVGSHLPVQVYPVSKLDPQSIMTSLREAVPDATLAIDRKANAIVATARRADQELIRDLIDRMEASAAEAKARVLRTYPTGRTDPQELMNMIDPVVRSDATIVVNQERRSLLVWAEPKLQKVIRNAILQLRLQMPEGANLASKVYRFRTASPQTVKSVLATLYPEAKTEVNMSDYSLVVSASPEEQKKIQATIEQIEPSQGGEGTPVAKSYTISAANASVVQTMIARVFARDPNVQVTPDTAHNKILVVATPAQQKQVAAILDQIKQRGPPDQQYKILPYSCRSVDPAKAAIMLQQLYPPPARFEVDQRNRRLLIWAQASDHPAILEALKAMDTGDAVGSHLPVEVYSITKLDPQSVMKTIQEAVPDATIAVDRRSKSIVVTARRADQEVIRSLVDKIEASSTTADKRELAVYPTGRTDPKKLSDMIDPILRKQADIVVNEDRRRLLVWADRNLQKVIRNAILQLRLQMPEDSDLTSKVYRFHTASPQTVKSVLATLYPEAKTEVNMRDYSLVVSASPEEQKKIQATIEQIEPSQGAAGAPIAKSYKIGAANPAVLQAMIAKVFMRDPQVQVTPDRTNNKIIAIATPAQQEMIRRLVEEMEKESEPNTTLEVYPLESADAATVQNVLTTLFAKQPVKPQLSIDRNTNQLVAIAEPEQQAIIQAAVERLQKTKVDMEVFHLRVVDPDTAQLAIENLFGTYFGSRGSNVPHVESDPATQQLYVRADPKQLDQIRQLLIKMGETSLTTATAGGGGRHIRVIPFKGDTQAVVRELERMWKAMHGNPIQTVTPSAVAPTLRKLQQPGEERVLKKQAKQEPEKVKAKAKVKQEPSAGKGPQPRAGEPTKKSAGKPAQAKTTAKPKERAGKKPEKARKPEPAGKRAPAKERPQATGSAAKQPAAKQPARAERSTAVGGHRRGLAALCSWRAPGADRAGAARTTTFRLAVFAAPKQHAGTAGKPAGTGAGAPGAVKRPATHAAAAKKPVDGDQGGKRTTPLQQATPPTAVPRRKAKPTRSKTSTVAAAPIVVAAGDGSITIASDDLTALNEMENLLRSIAQSPVARDNNFQVYALRNTDATEIARAFTALFKNRWVTRDYRGGRAVITADRRTNSIIVRASRADRATIESMLEVLDAGNVANSITQKTPTLIPLKNTRAFDVESVLRDIYKTQLVSGGGRNPIPVPSGLPEDVVAAIEQFNATAKGPLLTLGVDRATNGLLVSAPPQLVEEIRKLVTDMDTSAGESPAESLRVIPLKKAKAAAIHRTLQKMIQDARRGRRRR